jgi:hypothetical protein
MFLTEYDEKKVLEMEREEGRLEGRAEGESRLGSLINSLIRSGRNDDALRASTDAGYRKQLYQELNIQ